MPEESGEWKSIAWQQFLIARRELLARYDEALVHARGQAVATHHGVVGEAAVRDWLARFLPKRYGVTSGFIKSQNPKTKMTAHFDVIIYEQLEAPILWTDSNRDKSEQGLSRVVPAEYVRAVIEIKSALSRKTMHEAIHKLDQLRPLMGANLPDEPYPKYLPINTVLSILFFELRTADAMDREVLDLIRDFETIRRFYGPVVLRGEGLHPDFTGKFHKLKANEPMTSIFSSEKGMLSGYAHSGSKEYGVGHILADLIWGDLMFSDFAFDLLALLNGKFRSGFASSFHGFDFPSV